jgi:hypothetical protein
VAAGEHLVAARRHDLAPPPVMLAPAATSKFSDVSRLLSVAELGHLGSGNQRTRRSKIRAATRNRALGANQINQSRSAERAIQHRKERIEIPSEAREHELGFNSRRARSLTRAPSCPRRGGPPHPRRCRRGTALPPSPAAAAAAATTTAERRVAGM